MYTRCLSVMAILVLGLTGTAAFGQCGCGAPAAVVPSYAGYYVPNYATYYTPAVAYYAPPAYVSYYAPVMPYAGYYAPYVPLFAPATPFATNYLAPRWIAR